MELIVSFMTWHTWADYKTNSHIAKELEITPVLDKLLEYKRNWIQHVNRMPRDRLPWIMKHYSPTGRRNCGRPLKRRLDTWDRNRSTSGLTQWQKYDDDDDDLADFPLGERSPTISIFIYLFIYYAFSKSIQGWLNLKDIEAVWGPEAVMTL